MKKIEMDEQRFSNIEASINRIEIGLFGDKEAGIDGLVGKVKKHEKKINTGERILWGILGAG